MFLLVDANFQRQCLEAHNVVREKYGQPQLIWSQELADLGEFFVCVGLKKAIDSIGVNSLCLAKSWAINLAERGRVLYPELPGIGENIHLVIEGHENHLVTGSEIVALWASGMRFVIFQN